MAQLCEQHRLKKLLTHHLPTVESDLGSLHPVVTFIKSALLDGELSVLRAASAALSSISGSRDFHAIESRPRIKRIPLWEAYQTVQGDRELIDLTVAGLKSGLFDINTDPVAIFDEGINGWKLSGVINAIPCPDASYILGKALKAYKA